ncbi:hypothetical protein [Flavobacterium sp. AED]|uniref:hypothetical protein n=1 Tax=Flavobacterium sp. AED TaxID=1423323 RepID=UPI0005830929|nr:hypothetical protein [Flavobacterium sp. AED]KIA85240.1 hypothetical protein OA85_12650 [Flavobacterium sp. AED]
MMNKKWIKKISLFRKQLLLLMYYGRKINFFSDKDKGRIVICFDGLFSHGGLVDRLKGIISFYEIAKSLDYDFYISFTHPFQLSHFLYPNKVNWDIKEKELKYNPFNTKVIYLMDNFEANPLQLIKNSTAKTFFVYSNIDYLGTIYTKNTESENQQIWHTNYNELFAVSNELNKEIQKLPHDNRIVFHTRFTSLMGDFKDTTHTVLDENKKQELVNKLIRKMKEVVVLHPTKKVYVLSDSNIFLNFVKQKTSFSILEGSPKHIGMKNNNADLESNYKTFTDFYFMAKSDTLYLLKLDKMYNSGFSKYAAIVGNNKVIVLQE